VLVVVLIVGRAELVSTLINKLQFGLCCHLDPAFRRGSLPRRYNTSVSTSIRKYLDPSAWRALFQQQIVQRIQSRLYPVDLITQG
jgi:hypothetical protein